MHEASLVQGLLDMVLAAREDYNSAHPGAKAGKIREIVCGAGLLAAFEENTLRGCLEIFAEGTPAEGARLVINTTPLECVCGKCGASFRLYSRHFACPQCGSGNINFSGGNGLVLESVNVDCADADKNEMDEDVTND